MFSKEERELLVRLRSKCYNAKANFRNMHQNKTNCTFGCPEVEDQEHIFVNCPKINKTREVEFENIDKTVEKQKEVIEVFLNVDKERKLAMEALLPGGDNARTLANPSV